MKQTTREWVQKAEDDFVMAKQIGRSKKLLHDGVCFHCQQCAEKYLKALLDDLALVIPRTHNLDDLLGLLTTHHPKLRALRRGLIYLTDFAVDYRYPTPGRRGHALGRPGPERLPHASRYPLAPAAAEEGAVTTDGG